MQKRVDVDPWSVLPAEEVTVGGIKVRVRGLNYRELTKTIKPCKGDDGLIAEALVVACVTRVDGKPLNLEEMRPDIFNALSEAVARAQGFDVGNLKATGADASSIA